LVRSLRKRDLVAAVINGVIGAGIFGLPAKVYGLSAEYSLFAFVVCAACVSVIVLSFGEVASRFSGTGGPYLYAREAFGRPAGFAVGWLLWVARISAFAANIALLPDYLALWIPALSLPMPRGAFIAALVAALAFLNVRGIRPVARASNAFAIGKLGALFAFVAIGVFFVEPSRYEFSAQPGYQGFALSVMLLIYAFSGFEMALVPAGEAVAPERDLPRALLAGMAMVIAVYIGIQFVCIGTLPELGESKRPLADAASRFMGPAGAALITAGIVCSLAGNLNILILSASRVLFAMGEREDLPAPFATVHPAHHTPALAVAVTCLAMLALAVSGTFVYLVTISTISRLVCYLATCAAMPALRRSVTAAAARFMTPGGVPVAFAGIAIVLWLLSSSTLRELRDTSIALCAGFLVFLILRERKPQVQ
jgi:amino acid transporter